MRAWVVNATVSGLLLATLGFSQERSRAAPRPSPAETAVAEGVALFQLSRVAEARARFERALALDPASVDARYMLGWLREQEKDLDGAARDYEAALAIAPGRAEIHDRLASSAASRAARTKPSPASARPCSSTRSCSTRATTSGRRYGGRATRPGRCRSCGRR